MMRQALIGFASFALVTVFWADAHPVHAQDSAASRFETRCGWFSNPTPANAWLDDKDGQWTIGVQGGRQADGDWPDFKPGEWVRTNGNYGYGCACLQARVDRKTLDVLEIKGAHARPLLACRKDGALHEPND